MITSKTIRNNLLRILFEAFFPIFLGGMIYILFRTDSLLIYRWFERLNISNFIYQVKDYVNIVPSGNFKILINTMPNGLWAFSYSTFLLIIWNCEINSKNVFYFLFIPVIAIASEFMQLAGFLSGTFDILDIISYVLGATLPLILHFRKINIILK